MPSSRSRSRLGLLDLSLPWQRIMPAVKPKFHYADFPETSPVPRTGKFRRNGIWAKGDGRHGFVADLSRTSCRHGEVDIVEFGHNGANLDTRCHGMSSDGRAPTYHVTGYVTDENVTGEKRARPAEWRSNDAQSADLLPGSSQLIRARSGKCSILLRHCWQYQIQLLLHAIDNRS